MVLITLLKELHVEDTTDRRSTNFVVAFVSACLSFPEEDLRRSTRFDEISVRETKTQFHWKHERDRDERMKRVGDSAALDFPAPALPALKRTQSASTSSYLICPAY